MIDGVSLSSPCTDRAHYIRAPKPWEREKPKDKDELKKTRCAQEALLVAIGEAAADFIGIPRGDPGTFGYDLIDPSSMRGAAVDIAATGIEALKRPEFQALLFNGMRKVAGKAAVSLAEKAIPWVGWGLALYQTGHALYVGAKAGNERYEACLARAD